MVTLSLPNTLRSLSSARISRRLSGSCRLLDLMYSHTLLTTSPRGRGPDPTTAASASEGCSVFCKAFPLPPPLAFGAAFFGFSAVLVGIWPPGSPPSRTVILAQGGLPLTVQSGDDAGSFGSLAADVVDGGLVVFGEVFE